MTFAIMQRVGILMIGLLSILMYIYVVVSYLDKGYWKLNELVIPVIVWTIAAAIAWRII